MLDKNGLAKTDLIDRRSKKMIHYFSHKVLFDALIISSLSAVPWFTLKTCHVGYSKRKLIPSYSWGKDDHAISTLCLALLHLLHKVVPVHPLF